MRAGARSPRLAARSPESFPWRPQARRGGAPGSAVSSPPDSVPARRGGGGAPTEAWSARLQIVFQRIAGKRGEALAFGCGTLLCLRADVFRHPELHARRVHAATGQRLAARDEIPAADLGERVGRDLLGALLREPGAVTQVDFLVVKIDVLDYRVGFHDVVLRVGIHRQSSLFPRPVGIAWITARPPDRGCPARR